MEQRLSIICLAVQEINQSNYFYEKIFGWEKTKWSNENITFFQLNGLLLSLYSNKAFAKELNCSTEMPQFKSSTLAYNTKSEKEVDELSEHFVKNDVNILKMPHKTFWGGYSSYITDPDHHIWEIAYNPMMEFDLEGNVKPDEE